MFSAMKEYPFTFKCLSRRQFLKTTFVCGGTSAGLGYWNALSLSQETRPRRQAPNDGLSLAEYLIREASKMDYFPCGILSDAPVRFRAALTFERYLKFYRYKERVLSSTREEIDDCIRQIDDFPSKTKALVLAAIRLFRLTHSPGSGYEKAYRGWQEQLERIPDPVEIRRSLKPLVTDLDSVETRSYLWGKRSYYPFCYPVLWYSARCRVILILGAPTPDSSVDKDWIQRSLLFLRKYELNKETAFPFPVDDDKETPTDDFVRTSQRLKESPLRFLAFTHPTINPRFRDYSSELPNDERDSILWFKWFKNIEECVAVIRRELDLTIPAERWISDYYPDADGFLQKVAELENDESTSFEKVELLTALREYWFSMQIPFEYHLNPKKSPEKFISPHTGEYPFYDVLGNRSLSLQDVFLYFRPSSNLL